MLEDGAPALEELTHILTKGELAKFNPRRLGLGPGGGQFATAEMDTTNSRDTKPQGCVKNLRREEILEKKKANPETPGRSQPGATQG
ncbi:MAG: hypothetical protein ACR2KT_14450 [Methylocella sp.]|nr:MAG: hypothetical protein DLM68_12830 [Hyphomicrobiales bacterium]